MSVITLSREWTEQLTHSQLNGALTPGVRMVQSKGTVTLEGRLVDVTTTVTNIEHIVENKLCSDHSDPEVHLRGNKRKPYANSSEESVQDHREPDVDTVTTTLSTTCSKESMSSVADEKNARVEECSDKDGEHVHKEDLGKQSHEESVNEVQPKDQATSSLKGLAAKSSEGTSPGFTASSTKGADETTLQDQHSTRSEDSGTGREPSQPNSMNKDSTSSSSSDNNTKDMPMRSDGSEVKPTANNVEQPEKYFLDEPLWRFIQFLEPDSKWDTKFSAFMDPTADNERIELTGSRRDVKELDNLIKSSRLDRAVTKINYRVPKGVTLDVFVSQLQSIGKNKILVRQTKIPNYCEIIGKQSEIAYVTTKLAALYPEFEEAKPRPEKQSPLPMTTTPLSSQTAAASDTKPNSPTSGRTDPNARIPEPEPMQQLEFRLSKSNIRVKVFTGNLVEQQCEVLVNPCNPLLDNTHGLSKALATAAGAALDRECKVYLSQHHAVHPTQAIDTTAGNMPAPVRRIIHACGPSLKSYPILTVCCKLLETTFLNCFLRADAIQARSVALPAISSGVFAVPVDIVATAAFRAVTRLDSYNAVNFLDTVCFVNIQPKVTAYIVGKFRRLMELNSLAPDSAMNRSPCDNDKQRGGYLDYSKIMALAQQKGFVVVDFPADGNSALHAVARHLQRQESRKYGVSVIRKVAVKFMHANRKTLFRDCDMDVDAYLSNQAMSDTFCDKFMLQALVQQFARTVHVIDDDGRILKFEVEPKKSRGSKITLGLVAGSHYVSLEVETSANYGDQDAKNTNSSADDPRHSQESSRQRAVTEKEKEHSGCDYTKMAHIAKERGYVIQDVPRDGDSALIAIIHQLQRHGSCPYDARILRGIAVQHLRTYSQLIDKRIMSERFHGNMEHYLSWLASPSSWCDASMLRGVAEVLFSTITVLHDDDVVTKYAASKTHGKEIILGLIGTGHYVSLEACGSSHDARKEEVDLIRQHAQAVTPGPDTQDSQSGRFPSDERLQQPTVVTDDVHSVSLLKPTCTGSSSAPDAAAFQHTKAAAAVSDAYPTGQPSLATYPPDHSSQQAADACYWKLKDEAFKRGFDIVDVPRDRDSAFHAVANQVKLNENIACDPAELRQKAVERLRSQKHGVKYIENFQSYQSTPNSNNMMLHALADMLGREIHILEGDGNIIKVGTPKKPPHILIGKFGDDCYVNLQLSGLKEKPSGKHKATPSLSACEVEAESSF